MVVCHGTQAQTQLDLNPAIGVRLPASLPVVYLRFVGPICAHVPLSLSSLWVQWSPHPGPGFPTFAGIFEFAIRYFALERCFPLSTGTLFILLSLEVPRYQDTPSAQVLTGIIRSPLSKNLQRVLLRRDPFRHQPLPHLVFCFHIMLISSDFLRFERKCGRGWHHRQSFQSPPIHTG